jgi:undecaprenyl pyrophosphate phosphatase UppP
MRIFVNVCHAAFLELFGGNYILGGRKSMSEETKKDKSGDMLSKLGTWIIVATVLGAVVGLVMGKPAHMFAPMGDLFMQLIKMVIVPMVFFSQAVP